MFKNVSFFCIFMVTLSTSTVFERETEYSVIDALIRGLKDEVWNDEERPCFEKILELFSNVKNFTLWATWVWDANRLPSGSLYGSWNQLGNFDQCMSPPWLDTHPELKTQYCLAEVQLTPRELNQGKFDPYGSAEVFLKTKTRLGLPVNRFTWGVCLPTSCQSQSLLKIVKHMYLRTHFKAISRPNITVDSCQIAGTKDEYSIGYYLFMSLISTAFIISILSTIYLEYNKKSMTHSDLVTSILKSFCMKRNSAQLTKSYNDEIKVLNGIRFLSAFNIAILHISSFTILSGCVNSRDLDNKNQNIDRTLNIGVIVDTFFVMSGLLYIRSLLAKEQQNLLIALLKRYIRLIGIFGISIFYTASVISFHGSGPLWRKIIGFESEMCQKYWYLSLLMINTSKDTICYPLTWYPACDYQLTVFTTILFCVYRKSKSLAIKIFWLVALLSLAVPGFLTYWLNLPPLFVLDFEHLINVREHEPFDYTYFKSYSRATPYLTGMIMGYFMHIYKPAHYRKRLSTIFSIAGYIFSLLLMVWAIGLGSYLLEREYDAAEAGVIAALYRPVWGIAVCCIIACCEYGYVPLVTDFLSMPFFVPLGRLSYGLYLVHFMFLIHTKRIYTVKSPPVYDTFATFIDTAGIVAVSLAFSYFLWLILEAPMNNLSNLYIRNR